MNLPSLKLINSNEQLLEKVILQNDLGGLSPVEKVQHVKNVCNSIGLNPLTKPIQLIKFQDKTGSKEIMYMTKDGAEQLRNIHEVSINKLETEILNNKIYVVRAYARKPNGREDCSTSAVGIEGLNGSILGNAMKKCETQAKRRVTLSICGLGMLDESEISDLPNNVKKIEFKEEDNFDAEKEFEIFSHAIDDCENISQLQTCFMTLKSKDFRNHPELFKSLIDKKDQKKMELMVKSSNEGDSNE